MPARGGLYLSEQRQGAIKALWTAAGYTKPVFSNFNTRLENISGQVFGIPKAWVTVLNDEEQESALQNLYHYSQRDRKRPGMPDVKVIKSLYQGESRGEFAVRAEREVPLPDLWYTQEAETHTRWVKGEIKYDIISFAGKAWRVSESGFPWNPKFYVPCCDEHG